MSRRGHGGTRSRRRATKRRRCVDYAGRPLWVYALSDDHDRGALIREASGLRLVRPFSKPFWTFAGHSRGTESRNQEDLGGPGRTRSRQQSNTSGHLRSREDTGGHVSNTVRDREAPGSNPGPPTKIRIRSRCHGWVWARGSFHAGARGSSGRPVWLLTGAPSWPRPVRCLGVQAGA